MDQRDFYKFNIMAGHCAANGLNHDTPVRNDKMGLNRGALANGQPLALSIASRVPSPCAGAGKR